MKRDCKLLSVSSSHSHQLLSNPLEGCLCDSIGIQIALSEDRYVKNPIHYYINTARFEKVHNVVAQSIPGSLV